MAKTDALTPTHSDRFTSGLWTVDNPGRDLFGVETRPVGCHVHNFG
jgi:hypothetical protein